MRRVLAGLLILATAAAYGCGGEPPAAGGSAAKAGKTTYICHMGADCGKADVAAGESVPSCCGKVMVKAETYSCACGKTKIVDATKPPPECCGAAMKKVQP